MRKRTRSSADPQSVFCEVSQHLEEAAPPRPAAQGIGPDVTDAIARWAADNPDIRRVWVYGSCAKGTYSPDSGIDIAVELKPVGDSEETFVTWMTHGGLWRSQLQSRVSAPVDLEWFDPDGSTTLSRAALVHEQLRLVERGS